MEGRRITANFETRYQVVIPISRVSSVAYDSPRSKDAYKGKRKEKAFNEVLKQQLNDLRMEENQTFQLYC